MVLLIAVLTQSPQSHVAAALEPAVLKRSVPLLSSFRVVLPSVRHAFGATVRLVCPAA